MCVRHICPQIARSERLPHEYSRCVAAKDVVPPSRRASDADRERAIDVLRDGTVRGRLSHETFLRRLDVALRARASEELDALVRDLPLPKQKPELVFRAVAWCSALSTQLRAAWQTPRMPSLALPRGDRTVVTIGRAIACDFVLGDATVSRRHAELRSVGSTWVLVDLDSTNGTRANGWRVRSGVAVRPGDIVAFGRATFRLVDG